MSVIDTNKNFTYDSKRMPRPRLRQTLRINALIRKIRRHNWTLLRQRNNLKSKPLLLLLTRRWHKTKPMSLKLLQRLRLPSHPRIARARRRMISLGGIGLLIRPLMYVKKH